MTMRKQIKEQTDKQASKQTNKQTNKQTKNTNFTRFKKMSAFFLQLRQTPSFITRIRLETTPKEKEEEEEETEERKKNWHT